MKLVIFDAKEYDKITFNKANKNNHEIIYRSNMLTIKHVHEAEGADAVSGFVNCDGSREVLEALSKLGVKYWLARSAGYDRIDLKAAKEFGIKVYRVPGYSPEGVAEHAMTLIMAINRNIHIAYNRTTAKNFSLNGLQGDTIHGQTIGVLGAGRIGQAFIKIANGLGANVLVFDEYAEKNFPDTANELGFKYVDKKTIFKESDYISLHLPLTDKTKQIINKETLSMMKKSAIIANTSRGELINTADLLNALDAGNIRGAGLDVYEKEQGVFFFDRSNDLIPDPILSRLRAHRNVIMTSHQAFFTNLALKQIAETTIANLELAEKNEDGKTRLILQEDGKILNG